eukprot:447558-Pelagomonas_calceolata.AAC.3
MQTKKAILPEPPSLGDLGCSEQTQRPYASGTDPVYTNCISILVWIPLLGPWPRGGLVPGLRSPLADQLVAEPTNLQFQLRQDQIERLKHSKILGTTLSTTCTSDLVDKGASGAWRAAGCLRAASN